MLSKRKLFVLFLALVAIGVLISSWPLYPLCVKKLIIEVTSTTKWTEYQKLTKMLSIGMEPSQVEQILGKPSLPVVTQSNVQCWIYDETGPTAGWTYIAEFKLNNTFNGTNIVPKLCYIANVKHTLFPDLGRFEMGQRIAMKEPEETFVFGFMKRGGNSMNTNAVKDK